MLSANKVPHPGAVGIPCKKIEELVLGREGGMDAPPRQEDRGHQNLAMVTQGSKLHPCNLLIHFPAFGAPICIRFFTSELSMAAGGQPLPGHASGQQQELLQHISMQQAWHQELESRRRKQGKAGRTFRVILGVPGPVCTSNRQM